MYAAAAYCFKWHFNWNWNCNERCTNGLTDGTKMVDYFFKDSTTGFVAYNDAQKSVIVSFRGTLGPLNFFRDLQLNVVPLDIGKTGGITPPPSDARVHNGFQITLEVARERVRKAVAGVLANPARANYAVTVVGHSLGGAIATLASIDLKDFLGNKNTVNAYTFGAPRVGNEAFAKWVDSLPITISRITALHDPIPTVPRREWYPLNYQHANTEFYTDAGKTINKCTEPANGDEPADCLNGEPDLIGRDIASLLTPVWIFWHLNNYAKTVFGPWC
ncbi:Alpha/Beta hydrolase protein [Powellomyces hirtus]|nr:Alpha/Beta hydrolase protein [Powellomyces hirtus]